MHVRITDLITAAASKIATARYIRCLFPAMVESGDMFRPLQSNNAPKRSVAQALLMFREITLVVRGVLTLLVRMF